MLKIFYSVLVVVAFALIGCAKEEPLKRNEDLANLQTPNFDGSLPGGGTGGSGGGSGGGNLPSEYYRVTVDSVQESYSNPFYQEAMGIYQIVNDPLILNGQIQISLFSEPQDTTYNNPFVGYFKSATESYQGFNGQLVLDSVTSTFIKGSYDVTVINAATNDTIVLSNASFLVHR